MTKKKKEVEGKTKSNMEKVQVIIYFKLGKKIVFYRMLPWSAILILLYYASASTQCMPYLSMAIWEMVFILHNISVCGDASHREWLRRFLSFAYICVRFFMGILASKCFF